MDDSSDSEDAEAASASRRADDGSKANRLDLNEIATLERPFEPQWSTSVEHRFKETRQRCIKEASNLSPQEWEAASKAIGTSSRLRFPPQTRASSPSAHNGGEDKAHRGNAVIRRLRRKGSHG